MAKKRRGNKQDNQKKACIKPLEDRVLGECEEMEKPSIHQQKEFTDPVDSYDEQELTQGEENRGSEKKEPEKEP